MDNLLQILMGFGIVIAGLIIVTPIGVLFVKFAFWVFEKMDGFFENRKERKLEKKREKLNALFNQPMPLEIYRSSGTRISTRNKTSNKSIHGETGSGRSASSSDNSNNDLINAALLTSMVSSGSPHNDSPSYSDSGSSYSHHSSSSGSSYSDSSSSSYSDSGSSFSGGGDNGGGY